MIIYIADRNLNILGSASTSLPGGFRLSNDESIEDVETGVNSFEGRIGYGDRSSKELKELVQAGRFILKGSSRAFSDSENTYDSLYQIIETEFDSKEREVHFYAEDAGLDLLNKTCDAAELKDKTISQMISTFAPSDWTINILDAPTGKKSNTWDGESTCTERLRSVAGLFDCEIYYSFEIERFEITGKVINITKKRGVQEAIPQLRLNIDIDRIVDKTSIADLATAYAVTGGTPNGSNAPINLKGYSYSYTDSETGDEYRVDAATGQMRNMSAMKRWASAIDPDGLFVKSWNFDTTDKATLAGQARAALQAASKENVNYEVDFARLPDDVQIGDRINIIDEEGELYLEARLLQIKSSAAEMTQTATLGEFLIRDSGVSDAVREAARLAVMNAEASTPQLRIHSEKGETLKNNTTVCIMRVSIAYSTYIVENITDLRTVFGENASLKWYKDGSLITEGITDNGFKLTVSSMASVKVAYRCELQLEE